MFTCNFRQVPCDSRHCFDDALLHQSVPPCKTSASTSIPFPSTSASTPFTSTFARTTLPLFRATILTQDKIAASAAPFSFLQNGRARKTKPKPVQPPVEHPNDTKTTGNLTDPFIYSGWQSTISFTDSFLFQGLFEEECARLCARSQAVLVWYAFQMQVKTLDKPFKGTPTFNVLWKHYQENENSMQHEYDQAGLHRGKSDLNYDMRHLKVATSLELAMRAVFALEKLILRNDDETIEASESLKYHPYYWNKHFRVYHTYRLWYFLNRKFSHGTYQLKKPKDWDRIRPDTNWSKTRIGKLSRKCSDMLNRK